MREYYLLVDNQQVGPYTAEQLHELLAQGQLTAESPAWYDGLPDWAPLGTILEDVALPAPAPVAPAPVRRTSAAPTTVTLPVSHSGVVQTNVKQGALLGGLVCLLLGLGFMFFSLFSFIFYIPLFLVAVILSVVAMAQGRVAGGVLLLLFSLVVPAIVGLILFTYRASNALASVSPTPTFTTISSQLAAASEPSPPSQTDAPTPVTTTNTATTTGAAILNSILTNAPVVPSQTDAPVPPPAPKHPALDAKMGFRTYKLGTPLSQFDPNSIEAGEAFIKTDMTPYSVKDFDKTLGAAEIDSIQLDFVQDILQSVIVRVKGKQSSLALKDALIAAYGQPDETSNMMEETDTWNGDDCVLTWSTDGLGDDSSADFTSKSVDAKIKAITEQKAQAGAAAGAKNL